MLNITILDRFPKEIMDEFMNIYDLYFKGTDLKQNYSKLFYITNVSNDIVNTINKKIPLPFSSMQVYFFEPQRGRGRPHIDRGRKTAFQIPISVDIENSYTFSFNSDDISVLTPTDKYSHYSSSSVSTINSPKYWFYEWDDAFFDKYSLEKPILQNAAQPHGGANFGNFPRIIFSCSYKEEFDVVKSYFCEWI